MFGAVIGDHVKTAINTAIPTGAVIGLASMVASSGFVPKFVPSFRWLTDGEMTRGDVNRLLDCAVTVMARRNVEMTDSEVELFLDLGDRVRGYEPSS